MANKISFLAKDSNSKIVIEFLVRVLGNTLEVKEIISIIMFTLGASGIIKNTDDPEKCGEHIKSISNIIDTPNIIGISSIIIAVSNIKEDLEVWEDTKVSLDLDDWTVTIGEKTYDLEEYVLKTQT